MDDEFKAAVKSAKHFFVDYSAKHETDEHDGRPLMSGCTSALQRHLQCGYNRAAAIMTQLELDKFITAGDDRGNRRLMR